MTHAEEQGEQGLACRDIDGVGLEVVAFDADEVGAIAGGVLERWGWGLRDGDGKSG